MSSRAPSKVLLVGASSEIGRSIVTEMLRGRRGSVGLAGRDSERRREAARQFAESGHDVLEIDYDASTGEAGAQALMASALAECGPFDVIVVAVGAMSRGVDANAADEVLERDLDDLLVSNFVGPAHVANLAASQLVAHGSGRLVVLTSVAAVHPRTAILGYASAKRGLDTFVRGLDRRTRPHGIRCVVVRSGQVRTRMTAGLPSAPFTTDPDHVARRVVAQLGHRRSVIWSPAPLGVLTPLLALVPHSLLPKELS